MLPLGVFILALSPSDILNKLKDAFPSHHKVVRVTVFGDSGVGKTSLIKRFVSAKFTPTYSMTIGGDFASKQIPLSNDSAATIIFSDVAGQERFKDTREVFYAGAEIALAVFDLTRFQSLDNLLKIWIPKFIKNSSSRNLKIQLIGNKSDLENYTVITPQDIQELASKITMRFPNITLLKPYLLTSAKMNEFSSDSIYSMGNLVMNSIPA